jgi:hypothetical protein
VPVETTTETTLADLAALDQAAAELLAEITEQLAAASARR